MTKNLTTGSVFKNIFFFSLPYFLSYFLQTLYGMADLFIIGQFEGATSITAVSIGSQVMHMLTVMIVGLAMGTTVTIAQAVGAEDKLRVRHAVGTTAVLFFGVSLVLAFVLIFARGWIAAVMETPTEAVAGTEAYLLICFLGIPLITAYNIIASIFRGLGDAKSPMYFVAVACVFNIVLDCIFMGALAMGPAGAAWGTVISQAVSVVLALVFIKSGRAGIALSRADVQPDFAVLRRILRIGIPVSLQDGFIQIAFLVITVIANMRGLTDAAAVGIVEKVISFIFLVPSSMLSTVSALGAQNIGAGKVGRVQQTLWYVLGMTVSFGIVVACITQYTAYDIVALFTYDTAVIVAGEGYLQGYIFDCIFAGVHFCFSGYFCACGRSEISFLHNVVSIVTARIPLVYLASLWYPLTLFPMGLATATGSLVSILICISAFLILRYRGNPAFACARSGGDAG
ncbi:MATE family efflux transporter [uncultured Mitsuokella sp.]|uniref:MATE family efflux transporter n=1 Tax=uncultured Mitsuokella sp. TaxID=453120 RepID=UPI00266FF0D4|nr:MATE family efflux transporter [uncultured Mitsuokella sp.]